MQQGRKAINLGEGMDNAQNSAAANTWNRAEQIGTYLVLVGPKTTQVEMVKPQMLFMFTEMKERLVALQ